MRQGCPIAPYLYILQAEPLAQTIRNSEKISGIKIPLNTDGQTFTAKISAFADDTQLFHTTEESILEGFKILDIYCKASGAKLNLSKTKGLYLGSWKNKDPIFKKIKWVTSANALGVELGYNINYEEIWLKKFAKFKSKIDKWKTRDLTIEGKKLLINSYVLSSASYLIDVYTANIPNIFIVKTKELLCEFLWSSKCWKISQNNLALRKCHGGLELPDIENYIKGKKIKWLLKIHFSEPALWNAYGKYCLSMYDAKYGVNNFLMNCTNLKGGNFKIHPFYKLCLDAWCEVTKPICETKDVILEQWLFGNFQITDKGKSLFFPNWSKYKICKIKDIWDDDHKCWKGSDYILTVLNVKRNWMVEYNIIKNSIPQKWKKILNESPVEDSEPRLQNTRNVSFSPEKIMINGRETNFKKIKQKEIIFACIYPTQFPKCIQKWNTVFNESLSIDDIFCLKKSLLFDRKSYMLHWKLLHGAVYTEKKLQKMKKSNGICKICKTQIEDEIHLFVNCLKIDGFWRNVRSFIQNVTGTNIDITMSDIIFGYAFKEEENDSQIKEICNSIILKGKWIIWKERNKVKYGNKAALSINDIFENLVKDCKNFASLVLRAESVKIKSISTEILEEIMLY